MIYTVKNVKTFTGMEGYGYECSLYKDGKRIGTVLDTADGGEINLRLDTPELEEELRNYSSTFTFKGFDGEDLPKSPDIVIGELIDEYENAKRIRSDCKKYWVYSFKDNPDSVYKFAKHFSRTLIEEKYKDQILSCLNDGVAK